MVIVVIYNNSSFTRINQNESRLCRQVSKGKFNVLDASYQYPLDDVCWSSHRPRLFLCHPCCFLCARYHVVHFSEAIASVAASRRHQHCADRKIRHCSCDCCHHASVEAVRNHDRQHLHLSGSGLLLHHHYPPLA